MSEQVDLRPPRPPSVPTVEEGLSTHLQQNRRRSIIEVLSEDSGAEDDIEIISESVPPVLVMSGDEDNDDEIEITGHQQITPTAPVLPSPAASVRRRPPTRAEARNTRRRLNRRENNDAMLFVDYDRGGLGLDNFPEIMLHQQRALFRMFHSFSPPDQVSSAIMERLEREDENTLDRKIESENRHNRKLLLQKQYVAKDETPGYTNNVAPDTNLLCELCGVVLGEGIPADFKPDPNYDDELPVHAERFRVQAPWFCIRQCFDMDIQLSKRVFMAKCGHTFCGRCIKNIGNRPPGRRSKKKEELSILNPQISAPRKCPAPECGSTFNKSKRTFTELYL